MGAGRGLTAVGMELPGQTFLYQPRCERTAGEQGQGTVS